MLTPIAPHTLTHRPVVIPAARRCEVRPLPDAGAEDIYVTYDGQSGYPLQKGDSIRDPQAPRRRCDWSRRRTQLLRGAAREAEVGRTVGELAICDL